MGDPGKPSGVKRRKKDWFKKTLPYAIYRCGVEWSFVPLVDYAERERAGLMKALKRSPGICLVMLGFCLMGGYFWKAHTVEPELSGLRGATNYLAGVITEKGSSFDGLKKDFDSYRQSNQAAVISLNQDLNEAKRERDAAQQQAAFFAAGPSNIFNLISLITNSLGAVESIVPRFELFINGQLMTNGGIIVLHTNQLLTFRVDNVSDLSADDVIVEARIPKVISLTNVNASGWIYTGDDPIIAENGFAESPSHIWSWQSPVPLGAQTYLGTPDIAISTNAGVGIAFPLQVAIRAAKSKMQNFVVILVLSP
jgi:hypothetical protein